MPPAKVRPAEDSRSDASTVRERQIAAAAHARKSKQAAATIAAAASSSKDGGNALRELALAGAGVGATLSEPGVRAASCDLG
jgi:hypothetical protein